MESAGLFKKRRQKGVNGHSLSLVVIGGHLFSFNCIVCSAAFGT